MAVNPDWEPSAEGAVEQKAVEQKAVEVLSSKVVGDKDVQAMVVRRNDMLDQVRAIIVDSDEAYAALGTLLVDGVRALKAEAHRQLDPKIDKAQDLLDDLKRLLKDTVDPLDEAEREAKLRMARFLEAKKETARLLQEAEDRKLDEELEDARKEEEAAVAAGDMETVAAVQQRVNDAVHRHSTAMAVSEAPPAVAGITPTTNVSYEILDVTKLKKEYLRPPQPNKSAILAQVRAHRKNAEDIVGRGAIRVTVKTAVAASGG